MALEGAYLPPIIGVIQGDISDFVRKMQEAKALLEKFDGTEAKVILGVDGRPLPGQIAKARAEIEALTRQPVEMKLAISLDKASMAAAMAEVIAASKVASAAAGKNFMGIGQMLGLGGGMFGAAGAGSLASFAGFGFEHLLGIGAGLGGFAAQGLGGAGLLGLGALSTAGVGMGTDLTGMGQASGDIKEVVKAQNALNQAIAVYGANSTQAKDAQAQLNYQLNSFSPIAQQAVLAAANTAQGFHQQFNAATGAAESLGAQIIDMAMQVGEKFLPELGQAAATNMGIIKQSLEGPQGLFEWFGTQGLQIFTDLENHFTRELPTAMHAFTQGVELLGKTIDYTSGRTGGFIGTVDNLLTRFNSPQGFQIWEGHMSNMINSFHEWGTFFKLLIEDIAGLFSNAAQEGQGIVGSLTDMLKKLHDWEGTAQGKNSMAEFFRASKDEVIAILNVLPEIISPLAQIELQFAPALRIIVGVLADTIGWMMKVPGAGPVLAWGAAIAILGSKLKVLAFASAIQDMANYVGALRAAVGEVGILNLSLKDLTGTQKLLALSGGQAAAAEAGVGTSAAVAAGEADAANAGLIARPGGGFFPPTAGAAKGGRIPPIGGLLAVGGFSLGGSLLGQSLGSGIGGATGGNVGGILGGAAAGGMVGGLPGAVIGAGVGTATAAFSSMASEQAYTKQASTGSNPFANLSALQNGSSQNATADMLGIYKSLHSAGVSAANLDAATATIAKAAKDGAIHSEADIKIYTAGLVDSMNSGKSMAASSKIAADDVAAMKTVTRVTGMNLQSNAPALAAAFDTMRQNGILASDLTGTMQQALAAGALATPADVTAFLKSFASTAKNSLESSNDQAIITAAIKDGSVQTPQQMSLLMTGLHNLQTGVTNDGSAVTLSLGETKLWMQLSSESGDQFNSDLATLVSQTGVSAGQIVAGMSGAGAAAYQAMINAQNLAATINYAKSLIGSNAYAAGSVSSISGKKGLAAAAGGVISEPIVGFGLNSGDRYTFGEGGMKEAVIPLEHSAWSPALVNALKSGPLATLGSFGGGSAPSSGGGGGGGGIILNAPVSVTVPAGTSPQMAQQVGVAVQRAVDKSMNQLLRHLGAGAARGNRR